MTNATLPSWSVGDRLRKAREAAGLEQRQLAEAAGISRATISNAERGVGTPHLNTLQRWATVTGVPVAWLLGEVDAADDVA
jgi:transcriptional regulator with XRE-family HTH domain